MSPEMGACKFSLVEGKQMCVDFDWSPRRVEAIIRLRHYT